MKTVYHKEHVPKTYPRYKGPAGSVWDFDLEAIRDRKPSKEGGDASLGSWFIYCPGANILWYAYVLHLIHLRPLSDGKPVKFYLEGGTHEILLFALDPDWKVDLTKGTGAHHLLPINFAAQFRAGSDEEAIRYVLRALVEITEGTLNPDTDAIGQWVARFGANMLKK